MQEPRAPNSEEIAQLEDYLLKRLSSNYPSVSNDEREDARRFVEHALAAVFADHETAGPGYSGKLMTVVWSYNPDLCEVFIWMDGRLTLIYQSEILRQSAE